MTNIQTNLGFADHLTHKANLKHTRYGWLRLTPAYSVHLVSQILDAEQAQDAVVLDPFMGTGTTALVCAEKGVAADTTDINPFLFWLAKTKTAHYNRQEIACFQALAQEVVHAINTPCETVVWTPALHQIEKWWDAQTLRALGQAMAAIQARSDNTPTPAIDLLKIAFCRTMIERSNVSFAHQSMSFKAGSINGILNTAYDDVCESWRRAVTEISLSAASLIALAPHVILADARDLSQHLRHNSYSCVITSPPYPNRMSYIRELRPYMYWLGYLQDSQTAGELDWQAIGGTWGIATSRVGKWRPPTDIGMPFKGFQSILDRIGETSPVLSRYVQKYFYDMAQHCHGLFQVVRPGGTINYIVGNSKFYDVMLPVEEIFAALFTQSGFENIAVKAIRKRSSKKELFEYLVSGRKPVAT